MQRGYIISLVLAPLAAVFLQGCNHPAAGIVDVTTTLTQAVPAGSTVLQVASTAGFIANSKVTIRDPTTGLYETNVVSAVGSIVLMAPTENAYGVSTTVTMAAAGAGTITSIAAVRTQPNVITYIAPSTIPHGGAEVISLAGTPAAGDLLTFANETTGCAGIIPSLPVTAPIMNASNDTTSTVTATIALPGTYVVCYRSAGKTDVQVQAGPKLTVTDNPARQITAVSPTTLTVGVQQVVTLTGTVAAAKFALVDSAVTDCPTTGEDMTAGNPQVTIPASSVPTTAGTYDVCAGGTKQIGVQMTVAAASR